VLVVADAPPVAVLVAFLVPVAVAILELPVAAVVIVVALPLTLLEAKNPLQRPLLHVLYAHCASLEHAALKFPHLAIRPALLAQHCTPLTHWLTAASALHSAPRGSEPAAAVTVEGGAGRKPSAVVEDGLAVTEAADEAAAEEEVVAINPLQSPPLHVLNAHCASLVHVAWKFPQRGCSMEFVA
jgi:hypothetical protein